MANPRKGDKNKLVRFVFFSHIFENKEGGPGGFPPG